MVLNRTSLPGKRSTNILIWSPAKEKVFSHILNDPWESTYGFINSLALKSTDLSTF